MVNKELLRNLPAVDEMLKIDKIKSIVEKQGRSLVVEFIRNAIQIVRKDILEDKYDGQNITQEVLNKTLGIAENKGRPNLRPVINGTGIVLHTNLGRAVLSDSAKEAVQKIAANYSNLELDLITGERGSRYSHVVELLKKITGCEDALVVNNNAAAVLLALNTLSYGKEAIISRGQLVEIGGAFRVPEVMEASQGYLVEVGTTNKTYLRDYERAITEDTALLLKVHTSNYRVIGFTHEVNTEELVKLGKEKGIPVLEDLGSGLLVDLSLYKITDEPTVQEVISQGVDVVTISGDKLLGGPQAGIIIGKKEYIEKMKRNPLNRALRIDKMTIAALEATLREYLDLDRVKEKNPTIAMLTMKKEEISRKADILKERLVELFKGNNYSDIKIDIEEGYSQAGGGSLPTTNIPTYLITLQFDKLSIDEIAKKMRLNDPAVLVRIAQDKIIFDLRTIKNDDIKEIIKVLGKVLFN